MKALQKSIAYLILFSFPFVDCTGQMLGKKSGSPEQKILRGTINKNRSWWNVLHYDITFAPDIVNQTIVGKTVIEYKVVEEKNNDTMQIDLQEPLKINKAYYDGKEIKTAPGDTFKNNRNVWLIPIPKSKQTSIHKVAIEYSGTPVKAVNPPWNGGLCWKKDGKSRPFVSIACQGLGASVWYPCKDHQSDEPDNGAVLNIVAPDSLAAIGNGKLKHKQKNNDGTTTWSWAVTNPINNYAISLYIGKLVNFTDTYKGLKGNLTLNYWVLDYNLEKAKKHFEDNVKPMLQCFEDWFGPYPFYEDDYKLVEAPYLGMEHQSNVAYGNGYMKGYKSSDYSGSGWGKDWDYIIIHETGHEWFGNNITTNDIADMWVHEGFTTYSEAVFVECKHGKQAANEYVQGLRNNIGNTSNIIGSYGMNEEGSGDMYSKGANMIHTIRQIINNDDKFKAILRGLNKEFYHKTANTADIENYISTQSGINFSKLFDQYLRTPNIPVLEYKLEGSSLSYRWVNCIEGFDMPVKLADSNIWLTPNNNWQKTTADNISKEIVDKNFYIKVKETQ